MFNCVVPDEVEDVKGALSQFQVEFSNRYGIGPHFEADTLQNTMQKAFGTEARKRKLLGKLCSGAYLGGATVSCPPPWVARIAKLHRKVSKFCSSPNFRRNFGLNLSEDLFFCSSPNIGRKFGLNVSEDLFLGGRKIGLNVSEDLFFVVALHLILGENFSVKTFFF